MPLPSWEDLTPLQLIRLAENPERYFQTFLEENLSGGKPLARPLTEDEEMWIVRLGMEGATLQRALEELSCADIIDLWVSKSGGQKKRGRRGDLLYDIAWQIHQSSGKDLMVVYREDVLPALIEMGRIQINAAGEPDRDQNDAAIKSFLEAMGRKRKQHSTK